MNNISKFTVSIFVFFLFSIHQTAGQDSLAVLGNSWLKLKTQLQRRTDITLTLLSVINNSKKLDKDLVGKLKSTSADLSLFIDSSKNMDSLTIQATYQRNINLTQALSKILVTLNSDTKFKANDESRNLQMHLEGIENRITVAIRNHNGICVEYKRPDLIFGNTQTEK